MLYFQKLFQILWIWYHWKSSVRLCKNLNLFKSRQDVLVVGWVTNNTHPSFLMGEKSRITLTFTFTEHEDAETGQSSLSLDMLAEDLRQLVLDDNARFAEEMKKWDDEEPQRRAAVTSTQDEVTIVGETTTGEFWSNL